MKTHRPGISRLVSPLFLLVPAIAPAASIGVKFLDSTDTAWGSGVSAGAPGFAQTNWNFMNTDWSGNTPNAALFTAGLKSSTGATVSGFAGSLLQNVNYEAPNSDAVHYDSNNTWRSGVGNSSANFTLMNGYLDDGSDNQPYVNLSLNTISGVFDTYSVVLYVNGDDPGSAMGRYWIESWTDSLTPGTVITNQIGVGALGTNFNGTFIQAGGTAYSQTGSPVNVDASAGNYIVFSNLTARNIRIRSAGNGDPEDFGRGALNGFQLIDTTVPEPSSAMMLGGAGLLALARRRRVK
jgi:hypothetical protein